MSIEDNKINSPITVIQDLERKPTPSEALKWEDLQALFDKAPEALRQKLNALIDDIITDYALKTDLQDIVLGQTANGSLTDAKFDISNLSTTQFKTTTNSGNVYAITMSGLTALTDGFPLCVKFNVASTGAISINPNNLGNFAIVDYFGMPVTNVRANLIANLRYDLTNKNFQLLGKGGGGSAIASHLLVGKTATTDKGNIIGTAPLKSGITYIPTMSDQIISAGFEDGTCKVKGMVAGGKQEYSYAGTYTFTVPTGVVRLFAILVGGGGGGGGTGGGYHGVGGGAGGFGMTPIDVVPGQSISIVVGGGGALGDPYTKYPDGNWVSASKGIRGGSSSVDGSIVTGGEGGDSSNYQFSCGIALGGVGLTYGNNGASGKWDSEGGSWGHNYGVWDGYGGSGNMGAGNGGKGSSESGSNGKVIIFW